MPVKMTSDEYANLSDEEVAKLDGPPEFTDTVQQEEEVVVETPEIPADGVSDPVEEEEPVPVEETPVVEEVSNDGVTEPEGTEDGGGSPKAEVAEGEEVKTEPVVEDPAPSGEGESKEGNDDNKKTEDNIDYKALYEAVTAPFKANGQMISMKKPEDIVSLMQKGADYTKKLQQLQPHLKLVRSLENNNINAEKLNFLIDINKKDPKAIKQLLIDSGIDSIDLDTSTESGYQPGQNIASDKQVIFGQVVTEVMSTEDGNKFVTDIEQTWDTDSKQALYEDPKILSTLEQQRQSGMYGVIAQELARERALGKHIGVSELQAYYTVGSRLDNEGRLSQFVTQPDPAPVAQVEAKPEVLGVGNVVKEKVVNADKVAAAKAVNTKKTPKPALKNPLEMSDEEFMKNAELSGKLYKF